MSDEFLLSYPLDLLESTTPTLLLSPRQVYVDSTSEYAQAIDILYRVSDYGSLLFCEPSGQ
jgi:hypothetical protein